MLRRWCTRVAGEVVWATFSVGEPSHARVAESNGASFDAPELPIASSFVSAHTHIFTSLTVASNDAGKTCNQLDLRTFRSNYPRIWMIL
jgi:hypothetical protein